MFYFIIIVWISLLVGDGIILPALTSLPSGFGAIVFLSALAITFGIHRWVIGLGIVLAGLTELMIGTYFGVIIGAWLVIAWSWHLLNRFLNMKSVNKNDSLGALIPVTLFGLGLFVVGEGILWMISRFVYESGLTATIFINILRSPTIITVIMTELIITLFVFRFISSPKNA